MAWLTESQKDDILNHISSDEIILSRKYKSKKKEFDEQSIEINEIDDWIKEGWDILSKSTRKAKIQRQKESGRLFEDNIWCMFYELGFKTLNKDECLKLPWSKEQYDQQQIDILAVRDDAIFVVECKAAENPRNANFKKEIDHIEQTKEGITKVLKELFGSEKKIKFVFATRNYRFSETSEDLKRLSAKRIYHFNENAYNYVKNLIDSYKGAAIYQFYGLMFNGELINNEKIRIPALKGNMGKHEYYMLSIEPSTLLKIGFVLHRTKVNDTMSQPTYQRLLVPSRLKGIGKFIDDGGYFPNSIIINFDCADKKLNIEFQSSGKTSNDSESRFGTLILPNAYGIAYIIDGQHRVYGYSASQKNYKDTNTIPVVAFKDMDPSEQLQIFMDINENQKAVKPSLRLDLAENLNWDSPRVDSRMLALRSSIIKILTRDSNSILYNKISVGEDNAKLTFKPFDEALKKSSFLPKGNQRSYIADTDVCLYNCHLVDNNKAMNDSRKRISRLLKECYGFMQKNLESKYYESYIESNRGTFGFIVLLGSIHKYLILTEKLTQNSTLEEQVKEFEPFLLALANYLGDLPSQDKIDLEVIKGAQADTTWLRKFQQAVNKKFPQFIPDGYEKWLETQDKDLQEEGQTLGREIVEILKIRVIEKVQELFDNKWETSISEVRAKCKNRIIERELNDENFNPDEADWTDFLDFSDVKSIIEKHWFFKPEGKEYVSTFEEEFSIPISSEDTFKTKKERTRWLSEINLYRDAWEKTKGKPLNRTQVETLRTILNSLKED